MKRLLSVFALLATAQFVQASTVLAGWTFETSAPVTAGPVLPEVGTGSALGSHAGAAVYSSPVGNGSSHSWSSTIWAIGDYYQFQTSTINAININVAWDQGSSNTGPRDFGLFYSTNGTTFTQFGSNYIVLANASPNPVWNGTTSSPLYSSSVNLSSVTALNNQANVYFRLVDMSTVSANGSTVGSAGTDRVDNFTITPEPATLSLLALVGLAIRRRRR